MTKDFLGTGWNFPIQVGPDGRLAYADGPEKIRQSIWIILGTATGERQMLIDFGCGIHDLLFQANTAALRGMVAEKVQTTLTRWEPRIDIVDVRVETEPDLPNRLLIYVDYRIRTNNAFYNLVYPFFINEGVA